MADHKPPAKAMGWLLYTWYQVLYIEKKSAALAQGRVRSFLQRSVVFSFNNGKRVLVSRPPYFRKALSLSLSTSIFPKTPCCSSSAQTVLAIFPPSKKSDAQNRSHPRAYSTVVVFSVLRIERHVYTVPPNEHKQEYRIRNTEIV